MHREKYTPKYPSNYIMKMTQSKLDNHRRVSRINSPDKRFLTAQSLSFACTKAPHKMDNPCIGQCSSRIQGRCHTREQPRLKPRSRQMAGEVNNRNIQSVQKGLTLNSVISLPFISPFGFCLNLG